jgi:hypothetical protein
LLYWYKSTNTDAAAAAAAAGLVANTAEQLQMMHEEWAEASRSELRFMLRIFRQAIIPVIRVRMPVITLHIMLRIFRQAKSNASVFVLL